MAYLKLDGTTTPYEGEALLDFVKLSLKVSNGAAFCNTQFGYRNLDVSSTASVRKAIEDTLAQSGSSIRLTDVVKNSNSTITATFSGTDENLSLDVGDI